MSVHTATNENAKLQPRTSSSAGTALETWQLVFRPFASLKLTVTLFALAIAIILIGTLAQANKNMWEVINDYFRAWIAWVEFQVFLPPSWFPQWQNVSGGFWFPGGASIGAALALNLVAAHLSAFRIHARSLRLWAGVAVIAVGCIVTALVIMSGHNRHGLQGEPPVSWETLWTIVKISLVGAFVVCGCAAWAAHAPDGSRRRERWLLAILALMFGGTALFLIVAGERAYIGDSGMRILWQLIQGTVAGVILLVGCNLVFRKRGGIVLIHGGIALMMFGQFYVAKYDSEAQISLAEGETLSYARDLRQTELAVVDRSDPEMDDVIVIPEPLLLASARDKSAVSWWSRFVGDDSLEQGGILRHKDLPFDIKVRQYYENARLEDAKPGEENPATAGMGLRFIARPVRGSTGTDMGGGVDMAAAYVEFLDRDTGKSLGTHLLSQVAAAQDLAERIVVGDKTYEVSLRFRRDYKPYAVTLIDVRKDDYLGTDTPRNYSSDIRLVDRRRGIDRRIHIWMNNPLRYAGETFYQSGYSGPPNSPVERSTLQVVTNSGWLIPYVSCMLVAVGMLAHFWIVLLRFLRRRADGKQQRWTFVSPRLRRWMKTKGDQTAGDESTQQATSKRRKKAKNGSTEGRPIGSTDGTASIGFVTKTVVLGGVLVALLGWLIGSFRPPKPSPNAPDVYAFGRLPVIADGRVKPFDTLARTTLRVLSGRETFRDDDGRKQPAIVWLLDVIARPDKAAQHHVFRIDNPEVLDTLGLRWRKDKRYSVAELRSGIDAFEKQVMQARQKDVAQLSAYERKLIDLEQRLRMYMRITTAFQSPHLPPLPTGDDDEATQQRKIDQFRSAYVNFIQSIRMSQPPLAVPVTTEAGQDEEPWQSYAQAWAEAFVTARLTGQGPPEPVAKLEAIFLAYGRDDAQAFNKSVAEYQQLLNRIKPAQLVASPTWLNGFIARHFGNFYAFEAYFNHVAPFYHQMVLYLVAFVMAALAWLVWPQSLSRTTFVLLVCVFAAHTLALVARMYISGRPPVTNLYSSAVFIGWGVVALALLFELLYRNGIGNAIAPVLGFASLFVAHNLAGDGDTFTVLQAVLDTQFWLATHVVCITFGYATTFLAGGLGILFILRGIFTPTLDSHARRELTRMIYGTVCFSLFFSFVGTVLGGLWADDSWGRFWGWDPKENGALIIVLWNALVLHARWDGMIKERGLAVLAVGGNIVTAWSWFGVNELGVGLHSYGFTEGVLLALGLFVASQLLVIALGILPKQLWWSYLRRQPAEQ